MKKFKNILLIFSIVFLMSGCYQSEMTLNINSDKSVDLNAKILVEDNFDEEVYSNNKSIYDKRNIKIEKITEPNTKGYIISKTYPNINDISVEKDVTIDISNYLDIGFEDNYLFRVDKTYFKNKYTANFVISNDFIRNNFIKKEETTSDFIEIIKDIYNKAILNYGKEKKGKDYNSETNELGIQSSVKYDISIDEHGEVSKIEVSDNYYSYEKDHVLLNEILESDVVKTNNNVNLGIKFVVKLPTATLSNNAKEASNSGKTLTWILDSYGNNNINFSFELHNKENYIICFGLIIGIVLLIILVIFLGVKFKNLIRKKEEKKPIYKSEIEKEEVPEVISIDDK